MMPGELSGKVQQAVDLRYLAVARVVSRIALKCQLEHSILSTGDLAATPSEVCEAEVGSETGERVIGGDQLGYRTIP